MNFIQRVLYVKNFWLKVISVFLGIVLFFIVRTQQVKEYTRTARVKMITAPNVLVMGSSERVVEVTIRMPDSIFSAVPSDETLFGEVDVSKEISGKIRIRLSRENFPNLDKRYSLTIHEPWLELDLDNFAVKKLPIRAVLQGLPKEGWGIERVAVSPEIVEVKGPNRVLNKLEFLPTSSINIEGIDKNYISFSKVLVTEEQSLSLSVEKINVEVLVGPSKILKTFKNIPIETIGAGEGKVKLKQISVDVQIQSGRATMEKLNVSAFRALVDLSNRTSVNWEMMDVKVVVPPNTTLLQVFPESVSVKFEE